jgi:hypothetical protein
VAGGRLGGLTALCLAVAVSASAGTSSEAARIAIDSCIERLTPDIDIGYDRIAARCPDLARHLQESGASVWLPRDWKRRANDLSAGGLRELEELLARQSRDTAASETRSRRLNTDHLPAVLASLAGSGAAGRNGWWTRTKAWIRDVFERREEEDDDWFSRVVGQSGLSQAVIEIISYAALLLVVLLAAVIVVNELRVGGVPGRLRRRLSGWRRSGWPSAGAEPPPDAGTSSWSDLQKAAPAQRPRLLLELIASRLTAEGRLPQTRGLTIGELTRAARLEDAVARERFAQLARVCERLRFSNDQASSEAIAAALEGGRVLLAQISPGEQK